MLVPTILAAAVACLSLTGQALETRNYHPGPHHARNGPMGPHYVRKYAASRRMGTSNVDSKHHATSHAQFSSEGIWGPGFTSDKLLATSYEDAEYGGNLGGACGWNEGPNGHEYPKFTINGAAQKLDYFGEGLACGTCVELTPKKGTDAWKNNPAPLNVTIVNSCPGTCHSLDVEADSVRAHFHNNRFGQWDVDARVIPCGFLDHGVTIQYRQISHTIYDLRLGIRFQDGAVTKLQAKQSCSEEWIDMHHGESDQFTPVEGGGVSRKVLDTSIFKSASGGIQSKMAGANGGSENTIDLKITSFTGEVIYAWKVPQPMSKPEYWFDSKINFTNK